MVEYPETLPLPLVSGNSMNLTDTFIRSGFSYEIEQRLQYGDTITAPFNFICEDRKQMREFHYFFYTSLTYGLSKFTADWPIMGNSDEKIFRFTAPFKSQALGEGIYQVSCEFELMTSTKDLNESNPLDVAGDATDSLVVGDDGSQIIILRSDV